MLFCCCGEFRRCARPATTAASSHQQHTHAHIPRYHVALLLFKRAQHDAGPLQRLAWSTKRLARLAGAFAGPSAAQTG